MTLPAVLFPSWRRWLDSLPPMALVLLAANPPPGSAADTLQPTGIPAWAQDALVIANPAAAVGGCQAGIYTPAVNGIQPWGQALIRWLTGRHVMGNTAVLVRQEAPEGGAGLTALIDPEADYEFEVSAFVSQGRMFGDRQDSGLRLTAAVLDLEDRVVAETPIPLKPGEWSSARVCFPSGRLREVRCLVRGDAPTRLPCFYYAENFRLIRKDQAWWSSQNLFDAPRTAVRLKDTRQVLVQTLDPDVVGGHNGLYLNGDGYFSQQGIAIGGGQWEQEYNHLSIDDPSAGQFRDDGMAWDLEGPMPAKEGLWPGYSMCHAAPLWHRYQRDRMVRIAPGVQVISQDNICAPSFEQYGKGCFCRWCRESFRRWLTPQANAAPLRAAGIADPARFDIAAYVASDARASTLAKGRDAVLADPVLRAFVQFQYHTQLHLWRDNVRTAQQRAGRPLIVCGNQWGAGGQRPFSVALSQISDAAVVETGGASLTPRNRAWDALAAKLPTAAGEYRRPVWLYMTSLFHAPDASECRLRLNTAQAWADGGVPNPWATAPGASGWYFEREAALSRFIQRHRALFSRRDRVANTGLVYSLPTHAWRQFRAFNLSPEPYRQWFAAWAQLLEEAHVAYEINCWGHPLLGDDRACLDRLSRYDVLILPGVDCFSDAQRDAVRAFQARGGRVLSVACPVTCSADALPRAAGETLAAPGERLIEVDPRLITTFAKAGDQSFADLPPDARAAAGQLQLALDRALAGDNLLETDAPREVWANLWRDDTRRVLALHLVNGRIEVPANRFQVVDNSRWRVRLPAGLAVSRAAIVTPDAAREATEVTELPVTVSCGWATVVVPRLECSAVVALFDGDAMAAAEDLAQARRDLWRTSLIRDPGGDIATSRCEETLTLLRTGPLATAAPIARQLAQQSRDTLLEALRQKVSANHSIKRPNTEP